VRLIAHQQVATATDVNETLLASLTVMISEALRLDHVAIELRSTAKEWTRIAGRGDSCEHDESFPLAMGAQLVRRLIVGYRTGALGRRDRECLAVAVPAVRLVPGLPRLTADLRPC